MLNAFLCLSSCDGRIDYPREELCRAGNKSPAITEHFSFLLPLCVTGDTLQIQCYQCEEMKHNDCSTPEYIVNCTVNVQDMCQKEVLVKSDGKLLLIVSL